MEIPSFVAWVNSIPGPSRVIGIRGVSAKDGPDSQELSDFMTSVLRIEGAHRVGGGGTSSFYKNNVDIV